MSIFRPFKIFAPTPILGYGYNVDEFWHTIIEDAPEAIIADGGSTDPGPYMLGTGKTLCTNASITRDITPFLEACANYKTKVLISSAGGAGSNEQVDQLVDIIAGIAELNSWLFRVAEIKFKDDRTTFLQKFRTGKIKSCSSSPTIKEQDIVNATKIVAQMGAEPFLEVLKNDDVDIIIAGRSYDPAPFAAYCLYKGVDVSPAWHVGKIIECGGQCSTPKGRSIVATMLKDSFILTPTDPIGRCTSVSISAHTMYEKTRPDQLPGPGGVLHLDKCTYTPQGDGRSILVKGSRFVPTPEYEIKLEGVEHLGYRTSFIAGIRDPILIAGIEKFLETVRRSTSEQFPELGTERGPQLIFHLYGKNAVMGGLEPNTSTPHEIGIMGEAVGQSQEVADAIAGFSRTALLHGAYDGQMATAGNIASPLTPLESPLGPVFKFSIYHLMQVDDPTDLFPRSTTTVGNKTKETERNVTQRKLPQLPKIVQQKSQSSTKITVLGLRRRTADRGKTMIRNMAYVVRSKNSGPFEVTLDILFLSRADFDRARESEVLTPELIQNIYHLKSAEEIIVCMFFEPALAWKCTFKRPWPQGSIGERDTFGAQLHAPMLDVEIPADGQRAKL
ncbi:uncharacterized protein A1O5_13385 [Cladophialophora psammophila CBS 110553]|uniref:3-methylaspartate ammonia-lyase n=1 Tax=Cladophialophora psammophila CBS 110553 TaxID=1182543 RepID=W9VMQ7_9EURO|nr:uncharacterized protein A1O5_13385 [Cladophialophora psammophila CBS 110553]EXJ53396.1 hypothetical protein A1O5_13385 [Cladophialophora psammophila CBS 110553]